MRSNRDGLAPTHLAVSVAKVEQALVFASIIVGVAISDQIVSLHRLLRSGQPIRWHWAQPWFAVLVLLLNVMIWWSIVGEQKATLTIGEFLPILVQLILLALLTIATFPDSIGSEGVDLAVFYQSNRRYQWSLLALTLAWNMLADVGAAIHQDTPFWTAVANESEDSFVIAIMVALIFIRRWWLIALGMALLSMGPINWLSRSLG